MENFNIETENFKENEILTLKNVFYFIKRASLRILIYVLTAVLLVGIIFTGIYGFTKNRGKAITMLSLTYSGASEGLDPFGQTLDINYIKSAYIVENALKGTEYEGKANDVRNALVITPIIPNYVLQQYAALNKMIENDPLNVDLLSSINYYPTQFSIELELSSLKSGESKNILALVINQYIDYFTEMIYKLNIFDGGTIKASSLENYDYADTVDIYSERLAQFYDYINGLIYRSKDYKSPTTGLSLSELRLQALLLKDYELKQISDYVTANTLTKYTYGEFKKLRNERIKTLTTEKARLDATVISLQTIITNYEKTPAVIIPQGDGDAVEVFTSSEHYDSLVNQLVSATARSAEIEEKIKQINDLIATIPSQDDDKASPESLQLIVQKYLLELNTSFNTLADNAAATINEFYEKQYMTTAIKTTIPPVGISKTFSDMNAMFFFGVAVMIALIVALTETGIRLTREKKQKQAKPATV